MKFDKDLLKEKWFANTVALCSAVILYLALTHLNLLVHFAKGFWNVFSPVIMAIVIAYVLAPLVDVFSKYVLRSVYPDKLRHTLSVLLSILSVVLFFVILMVALVPQVIDSIMTFVGNMNSYALTIQRFMRQLSSFGAQHDIDMSKLIKSGEEMLQSITRILPENLNKILNVSYGFGTKLFDWMISFILAIYMLVDVENLKKGLVHLLQAVLPGSVYSRSHSFWSRCNRILIQYIAFDLLDGLLIGVLNWLFMVIMHMPYVAIISVVVGVTNLAPTVGPMVGGAVGTLILLLAKPVDALWFLVFTFVLQTIDGYVIKPRLFGGQLGVSSVWILISLIVGGRILGVAGVLLAIPFAAIGDFVYHDYIVHFLSTMKKRPRAGTDAAAAENPPGSSSPGEDGRAPDADAEKETETEAEAKAGEDAPETEAEAKAGGDAPEAEAEAEAGEDAPETGEAAPPQVPPS